MSDSFFTEDELEQCVDVCRSENCAGISMFQRRLGIGYTKASLIMDELENRGIVGPHNGVNKRLFHDPKKLTASPAVAEVKPLPPKIAEAQDDGGPAFPMALNETTSNCSPVGMSLRDYAAIHSGEEVQEMIPETVAQCAALLGITANDYNGIIHYPKLVAMMRYRFADAMLEARKRKY